MNWNLFLLFWNFLNFLKRLLLHRSYCSFIFKFLCHLRNTLIESLLNLKSLFLYNLFGRTWNQFKRRSHWRFHIFDRAFIKSGRSFLSISLQLQLLRLFIVIISREVHLKRSQNRNLLMLSKHEVIL